MQCRWCSNLTEHRFKAGHELLQPYNKRTSWGIWMHKKVGMESLRFVSSWLRMPTYLHVCCYEVAFAKVPRLILILKKKNSTGMSSGIILPLFLAARTRTLMKASDTIWSTFLLLKIEHITTLHPSCTIMKIVSTYTTYIRVAARPTTKQINLAL